MTYGKHEKQIKSDFSSGPRGFSTSNTKDGTNKDNREKTQMRETWRARRKENKQAENQKTQRKTENNQTKMKIYRDHRRMFWETSRECKERNKVKMKNMTFLCRLPSRVISPLIRQ